MPPSESPQAENVVFVSTRISGTDGVSLEIGKWAAVLERMGYRCSYICGVSDRPAESTAIIEEADFRHPSIRAINREAFGRQQRDRELSRTIHTTVLALKDQLYDALEHLSADLIIAENVLTIPINVPLGLALTEVLMESGIPCIAHHHDFYWERERFLVSAIDDYLQAAFPPRIAEIEHVAINSLAAEEFSRRTGLSCEVVPNVMDFSVPPPPPDEYAREFRQTIGLSESDFLILQPTRVVQRKGIEHSIELVRRLNDPRCKLVISHASGDETDGYPDRVREYAELLGVPVVFAEQWISHTRGRAEDGTKRYEIWDAYPHADLVTYPSTYEGFGNAFLEAIYFRLPILCNRYTTFRTDIEPYGFRAIVMDGFLSDDIVVQARRAMTDKEHRQDMTEHNFNLAQQLFSFDRLEQDLRSILSKRQFRLTRPTERET